MDRGQPKAEPIPQLQRRHPCRADAPPAASRPPHAELPAAGTGCIFAAGLAGCASGSGARGRNVKENQLQEMRTMRFGLAVKDIVPPFRTTMYGYGGRTDTFDGVHDPLTFTAVLLEEGDRRALLGATDLGTYPTDGRTPELMARLGEIAGCPRENVMLNASHTHGGPLVPMTAFPHHADTGSSVILQYEEWLFEQLADAAREAVANLTEGSLWIGQGKTSVPMNRRPDRNGQVPNAPNPGGPIDDRLFVFALRDASGQLAAVGVRVSCHPVATGAQHLLTADYPGAWRAEFARAFGPKVVPFFLQGVGADARPRHVCDGEQWRVMKHAELEAIGRDLMAESLAVLTNPDQRRLGPLVLEGSLQTVDLPCEKRYTRRDDFVAAAKSGLGRYAEQCLRRLDAGESVPDHQEFLVQTLWLDDELALLGLNGEVLCGLGGIVEAAVAPKQAIMLGYTNGVICYLPDAREMARGGYETESYNTQPWTGPLLPGIEHLLSDAVLVR